MDQYPKLILKPGREASVLRKHPWIFSGSVGRMEGDVREGDIIEVFSTRNIYLATGHFMNGSITAKLFSFNRITADEKFWLSRLSEACDLRRKLGLTENPLTNAYRLVFSEGDQLPGLIIDWYNGVAVVQTHSLGMHLLKPVFTEVLRKIYRDQLIAVYDKSAHTMGQPPTPSPSFNDQFLYNHSDPVIINELGHKFKVDFIAGQKTGFFLDQRNNRMFAQFYARKRTVLNLFSYTGAFSVYCLKGGAREVRSVDASLQAITWTRENIELNGFDNSRHSGEVAEIKKFLRDHSGKYDMIIVDPPAFAKTHKVTNNALHAYIQMNAEAIRHLEPGGLLFTFSCSQAISREVFRAALQSAAMESGKTIKVLHSLSQGPDHPVSIYHPEGEYLKGFILETQ